MRNLRLVKTAVFPFAANGRRGHLRTAYVGVDDELLHVLARDAVGYVVQGLVGGL